MKVLSVQEKEEHEKPYNNLNEQQEKKSHMEITF